MSTDSSIMQKNALEFKSASLNVPVLLLHSNDAQLIEQQLLEKISQAPEFFKHSPLLIDLQQLNKLGLPVDLPVIADILRNNHFMLIGIRGGDKEQNRVAIELDLPIHSLTAPKAAAEPENAHLQTPPQNTPETNATIQANNVENKLINTPVRSGQRVYAKGDLIVTATVSAGAEIMAEGNIHVYGSLRGRALAGVQGDESSRIFCSDLQAELISIAGNYKISDELDDAVRNHPVQIRLQDQALIITPI